MKKISIVSICLMLILTIIPLAHADGEVKTENVEKEYFEVYDVADFGQCARGVTTADFNDDGYMDFAVSYSTQPFEYSTISIFYNEGDLVFRQDDVYTFEMGYIDSLEAGDYDNDGDIDLMFSYSESRYSRYIRGVICILHNDGNNNFEKRTQIVRRGFVLRFIGESRIHPKITSADYDADGDIDILVGDNSGRVEFYKNNGHGEFRTQGIVFNYDIISWGVTSADFTGDNLIDFIVVASDREAWGKIGHIFLKQNNGLSDCFEYGLGREIANPGGPSALSSLDYDNDGIMDLVMGSGLSIYMNRDESFQCFRTGWYNSGGLLAGGLSSADFNNDGFDDIVAGGSSGIIRLLINNYGEFPSTEPYVDGKVYDIEPGEECEYTFTIADINNDDVYLLVEWEDETSTEWLGPYPSGSEITLSHTWNDKGTFTFRAKAKDIHGGESEWSIYTVGVESETVISQYDGDTIYVDDDGTADYASIQEALEVAENGDTIYVYEGTYYENLQIDKTITLTGEEKSSTIISGIGKGNTVNINADSVNIKGFSVKNGFDTGIYVFNSVDTSISNCIITSNNGHGIHLDLAKNTLISHCTVSSNDKFGICVCNLDGSRPGRNDNVISNCIISNNSDGVFLDDISGTHVEMNDIKDNRFYGVYLVFARDCEIKENNFIDNTENAFFQGGFLNSWNHNYWSREWNIGIKIILGITAGFPIPWFNFDRNPANEPFDINGEIL